MNNNNHNNKNSNDNDNNTNIEKLGSNTLELFNKIPQNKKGHLEKKWAEEVKKINTNNHKDKIFIGMGTCGLGAGAKKTKEGVLKYLEEKKLLDKVQIVEVGCIGLCAYEPLLDIELNGYSRVSFGKVDEKSAYKILEEIFERKSLNKDHLLFQFNQPNQTKTNVKKYWDGVIDFNDYPFFKKQTRWVLANCGLVDPKNINDYLLTGGYSALCKTLISQTPSEVCDTIEKSGLRGRGGGGFVTGKKWKFALNTPSEQKYFICNADEGDPGAFMDRAVIEGDPHRLIEGLAIASYAIGANKAYVYIRAEYPLAIAHLKQAIKDATAWGFLGKNIMDSNFNLEIIIKQGAGAFVCGEETALIHSIEGKRGMPRPRPPFPAVKGLFGKPTVINNVETLANVPIIARFGDQYFSKIGTSGSKGTKVFALSGKVNRTGLVEIAMGASIREIVFDIGGGIPKNKKYKAVQIGGPSGGCVPENHLDIKVDYESLKTIGAMMGSGGLVVMDEDNCMVDVAKYFMEFIQKESCGKCIPCREGTKRMLEILERITHGKMREGGLDALVRFQGIVELENLAEVIQKTSLCGLGQSAPNPVLSTMKWFKDEYEEHIFNRSCRALACSELVRFEINESTCKGCTLCAKKCPNNAIVGSPKAIHHIIDERCVRCGICKNVCKFNAVNKVPNV